MTVDGVGGGISGTTNPIGGNLNVKDLPRFGRPLTEKADEILQLIAIDRHASCQDITNALGINRQTQ